MRETQSELEELIRAYQIKGVGRRSEGKNKQCFFPRFVTVLLLVFAVDRIVSDGVVSGIRTLFSLAGSLYYD